MKTYFKSNNESFVLIELLLSVVIVSIITLVIGAFYINNQDVISNVRDRQEVHNEAYIALKYISRSAKNSDSIDLISPIDGYSSAIELTRLNIAGGEVGKCKYDLVGTELRRYPAIDYIASSTSYDSGDYAVIAKGISEVLFSDGEGEVKTEDITLLDVILTSEDLEGKISIDLATQSACRDRIFVIEYDWFDGNHNWQYNKVDGTLTCVETGYDWVITLEETGVLTPEVMDYMGYSDEDIINMTFADGVLTEIDDRPVIDGVVIIMKDDCVAIVPPEQTAIELHRSYGNYEFDIIVAAKIGGYAPTIAIGYYTYKSDGSKELVEVVPAGEWDGSFVPPEGEDFGFYMEVGASGYTYYTETDENPDSYDHAWEYVSDALGTLVIGWEDLYGGGDEDHQDFVFTVKPVGLAP